MAENAAKVPAMHDKPSGLGARMRHPLESLRHEVDRLFDDFSPFRMRFPASRSLGDFDLSSKSDWFTPAFDMIEQNGHYEVTAELPGIDMNHVDVKVSNNVLTIKGEKTQETEKEEKDYYLSERRFGSFQRSFELPAAADTEKIDAIFSNGVLKIKIPKTENAIKSEKKIAVKTA